MAWRVKYVDWYRETLKSLGDLIPSLGDGEVVDAVEITDEAIVRLGSEDRPGPALHLSVRDQGVTLSIRYGTRKALDHLARIRDEPHAEQRRLLLEAVGGLDARYQTRLYGDGGEAGKTELVRSYLTSRLDEQLLSRLLDEAESMRRGGTSVEQGRSVYLQPRSPLLSFVEVSTALDPIEYTDAASKLKPVLGVLLDIKTQRELIRERVEEPSRQVNQYRDYVEVLNQARRQGLISAERRRELDRLWRDNPDERDSLIEGLRELLNPKTANPL
ncbi:MAG TPA: hypothetical protein VGB32_08335 [Candidatus Bathyarchaeia archaeon]